MANIKNNQIKITWILFTIYLIVLTWIILFKMALNINDLPNLRGINLIPFHGSVIINNRIYFDEIINNLIAFIPVGLYISMIKPDWKFFKRILPIIFLSLTYEIIQFIFSIGASDITDLISNSLGGCIGVGLYTAFSLVSKEKTHKILNTLATICTVCLVGFIALLVIANNL